MNTHLSHAAAAALMAVGLGAANAATTDELQVTAAATVACKSKDDLDLIIGMVRSGDVAAYSQMFSAGRCITLNRGESVSLVDQAAFSGMYRVRPRGSTATYWMIIDHAK